MKFAHLADCHIGSWRDPKLKDISLRAFVRAIDISIAKGVDFILISGDLFNTSLPSIDGLKEATKKLKELQDNGIRAYMIAGSHDFSPSGKTMLDVLENAGLIVNVAKGEAVNDKLKLNFTIDKKTGVKIAGMIGKKGGLEKSYYEDLLREELENEEGYKIFLFHSLLSELKPKELEKVDSQPMSLLPKRFNYYAGGHPHFVFSKEIEGYGLVSYPGPLFPNNFAELEKLEIGGFYIVEDNKAEWQPIQIYNVHKLIIDCSHKTPKEAEQEIMDNIKNKEFNDTIVTLRLDGALESGKPADIDFKGIFDLLYQKSAYFVMKNTNALTTKEFEEIKIEADSTEDTEERLIKEHLGKIKVEGMDLDKEERLVKELIRLLDKEKEEGERVADFERRVRSDIKDLIGLK